jgi:hypothetical protein
MYGAVQRVEVGGKGQRDDFEEVAAQLFFLAAWWLGLRCNTMLHEQELCIQWRLAFVNHLVCRWWCVTPRLFRWL